MSRPKRHATAAAHALGPVDESLVAASDDELLRVDPSAMTERQQLAFLLRATAHAAATASDESSSDAASGSSGDESSGAAARAALRRIQRSSRASPRSANGTAIASGRARTPKNAAKLAPGQSSDDWKKLLSPRSATAAAATAAATASSGAKKEQPGRKRLKVQTAARSPRATVRRQSADEADADAAMADVDAKLDKTSPSSSSDVLRVSAFSDSSSSSSSSGGGGASGIGGDFWRSHCALCSDNAKLAAAYGVDALFLCPSCDQKYPTQRALGLV
ncbi:hypothetical protein PybrP1_002941 [[Pythium] brassicae (nom. inval.)]|nr:hypothetical protein PybrP1_002941 [[Pythium] brassicae (nom. inval.)]